MSAWSAAFPILGWGAGWALASRPHWLGRPNTRGESAAGSVSVVVPARNEALRLPRLLSCLAASDPAPGEVIVVDDESTDGTVRVAVDAQAKVISVVKPSGWTGKSWACSQGAAAANGEILLFLDADTEPSPGFVAAIAAEAQSGKLISVQPRHRIERLYEILSASPALVALLGAGTGAQPRRRWWRQPVAFGPALAIRRNEYLRLGGHGAVRGDIVEDLALARAADAAGVPVHGVLGGDAIGYRMYPEGVGTLVEGWSKNLASGARATPPARVAAVALWVAGALQVAITLAFNDSANARWLAGFIFVLFVTQIAVLLRRIGRFGWLTPVVYPLGLVVFIALFARSMWRTSIGRQVEWRGRRIPVKS